MRRLATLALCTFTLLGVMASAGCADSTASGSPTSLPPLPSSTTSAAVTSTTGPAASPSSALMVPPAAREHTVAGAEAFVRHYFTLLDYAFVTGDVGPYLAASTMDCESCQYQAKVLRDEYREGKSYRGGKTILLAVASPAEDTTPPVTVIVTSTREPLVEVARNGEERVHDFSDVEEVFLFNVRWQGSWKVSDYTQVGES